MCFKLVLILSCSCQIQFGIY